MTGSIRRYRKPAPSQKTFECDCGTVHQSPDVGVPLGWSTAHGQAWCPDCTTIGIPARELNAPRPRQRKAA